MAELKTDPKTQRAVSAYRDLEFAMLSLGGVTGQALSSFGLTAIQYRVLEMLLREGAMAQGKIGARLGRVDSNIHYIASSLEKRGLVIRRINSQDARSTQVHITPEGQRIATEIFPQHTKLVRALMSALDWREQQLLARLCRKLIKGDPVRFVTEIVGGDIDVDWEE